MQLLDPLGPEQVMLNLHMILPSLQTIDPQAPVRPDRILASQVQIPIRIHFVNLQENLQASNAQGVLKLLQALPCSTFSLRWMLKNNLPERFCTCICWRTLSRCPCKRAGKRGAI